MKIYIAGDTHGKFPRLIEFVKLLKKGDYVIVCGDWGYLFENDKNENQVLDDIEQSQEWIMLFVDGNHENFPAIYSYPEEIWNGGKVHRIRKNILHLCRGQVYELAGKKIFTMGGGYSTDAFMRQEGVSWWPEDEMPTEADFAEADKNLDAHNRQVDFIITHTAPYETLPFFCVPHEKERALNINLEKIRETTQYKHWFMGHLHEDCDTWRNQHLLLWDYFQIDGDQVSRLYFSQVEPEEFSQIKSGKKDIDIRIMVQKTRNINVGDYFVFYETPVGEYIKGRCVALHEAGSFEELLEKVGDKERMGFDKEDTPEEVLQKLQESFYKGTDREKGVVGIELRFQLPEDR